MTDRILDFWESQAKRHGKSHAASWADAHAIELEIEAIGSRLPEGVDVLDAGCANGHATLRQWEAKRPRRIAGFDFSPEMVRHARAAAAERNAPVEFVEGDIRRIPFPDASFDFVYTTRVLINLPTWEEQIRGIGECLRVARPGGTVVLSEAFWEPLSLLNAMRMLCGLSPLVEHDFNRYIKKERLDALLKERGLSWKVDRFSSLYYLGSRLVRELATAPDEWEGYSNPVNERFYKLEREFSGGDFGIQQAYVISKSR